MSSRIFLESWSVNTLLSGEVKRTAELCHIVLPVGVSPSAVLSYSVQFSLCSPCHPSCHLSAISLPLLRTLLVTCVRSPHLQPGSQSYTVFSWMEVYHSIPTGYLCGSFPLVSLWNCFSSDVGSCSSWPGCGCDEQCVPDKPVLKAWFCTQGTLSAHDYTPLFFPPDTGLHPLSCSLP